MRSASTTRWSSSCLQQAGSGGSRSFCRMLGSWCICRAQWRRCMSGMRSSTHKQVIPGMGGDECRMALQACVLAPHVAGFTAGRVLTEGREESTTACSLPAQSAPSQTGMRRSSCRPKRWQWCRGQLGTVPQAPGQAGDTCARSLAACPGKRAAPSLPAATLPPCAVAAPSLIRLPPEALTASAVVISSPSYVATNAPGSRSAAQRTPHPFHRVRNSSRGWWMLRSLRARGQRGGGGEKE